MFSIPQSLIMQQFTHFPRQTVINENEVMSGQYYTGCKETKKIMGTKKCRYCGLRNFVYTGRWCIFLCDRISAVYSVAVSCHWLLFILQHTNLEHTFSYGSLQTIFFCVCFFPVAFIQIFQAVGEINWFLKQSLTWYP